MISDWQLHRRDGRLILGIALQHAVLDVVSDAALLKNCLTLLRSPHQGLVDTRLGAFGEFQVTLNLHHDEGVSIFIDGPEFDVGRVQSAAIWVDKDQLCHILEEAIGADGN
jgi:hypothetical protein